MHIRADFFIESDTRAEVHENTRTAGSLFSTVRIGGLTLYVDGPRDRAEAIANAINAAAKREPAALAAERAEAV